MLVQSTWPNCSWKRPLALRFGWLAGFRSLAGFWWRNARRCTAGKILVGNREYIMFTERLRVIGQFLAQSGNLFGRNRAGTVPPLTPLVGEDIGDLLVGQCFVPGLHYRGAEFLAFDCDRTLQTLENNHGRSTRAAGCKLRTRQRQILTGDAEAVGLMTSLTIRSENLFTAVARRKFCLLLFALRSGGLFHRLWLAAVRIERITAEVSGVTTQIGTAKKHRQSIHCDQPD